MSYILKQPLKGVFLNMCSLKLVKLDVPNKYMKMKTHCNDKEDQYHCLSYVKLVHSDTYNYVITRI